MAKGQKQGYRETKKPRTSPTALALRNSQSKARWSSSVAMRNRLS